MFLPVSYIGRVRDSWIVYYRDHEEIYLKYEWTKYCCGSTLSAVIVLFTPVGLNFVPIMFEASRRCLCTPVCHDITILCNGPLYATLYRPNSFHGSTFYFSLILLKIWIVGTCQNTSSEHPKSIFNRDLITNFRSKMQFLEL